MGGTTVLEACVAAMDLEHAVREVLLNYLLSAGLPDWPGADGRTVHEVLLAYPEYAAMGRVPGLQDLVEIYPDLREELAALFNGVDQSR
jgi:hypothetical protein